MGLESGDFGAKKTILQMMQTLHDAKVVENGTRVVTKLEELHVYYKLNKSNTAVIVDGNVMFRAAPQLSYVDFCKYIEQQVMSFFQCAKHVIVVFDEPECITVAKREEQAARDAARKKRAIITSEDVLGLPTTDAYNEQDVANCPNVNGLIDLRATRIRLMDMIFARVMKEARRIEAQQIQMLGVAMTTLTFDGLDGRGDARGHDAPRQPGIQSTNEGMTDVLHRETPIGEGDLKLVAVEQAIERHRWEEGSPVASVRLVLHHTIDTDSLMISLIAEAERDSRGVHDLISILCLREPGRKRKGDDFFSPAHYQTISMQKLYSATMLLCFKEDGPHVRKLGREAVALVAMGLAACGCDFVGRAQLPGLRANEMMSAISNAIQTNPTLLPSMRGVWSGDAEETRKTRKILKSVLEQYGRNMGGGAIPVPAVLTFGNYQGSVSKQRQKYALHLKTPNDDGLLRAAWVCSYWHRAEFKNIRDFGF